MLRTVNINGGFWPSEGVSLDVYWLVLGVIRTRLPRPLLAPLLVQVVAQHALDGVVTFARPQLQSPLTVCSDALVCLFGSEHKIRYLVIIVLLLLVLT